MDIGKVLVQGSRLSQQGWGQSLRVSLAISPDCLNLSDLLAVVQLSLQADLGVRLDVCRQVSMGSESLRKRGLLPWGLRFTFL